MLNLILNQPSDQDVELAQKALPVLARLSREYGKIWDDADEFSWAGDGSCLRPAMVTGYLESATRRSGWRVEFNLYSKCIDIRLPAEDSKVRHACGLSGFNPMLGDSCDGCDRRKVDNQIWGW